MFVVEKVRTMNIGKADPAADPAREPKWLEALDHTADAGIIVHADDLKALFTRAAWGMFSVITDLAAVKAAGKVRIAVEAADRHALLVKWLSELNYRHVTEHWLFCRFDVLSLTDQQLEAEAHGERIDPNRHSIYTEIKAVTFHDLQIENVDGRWTAKVIFDL